MTADDDANATAISEAVLAASSLGLASSILGVVASNVFLASAMLTPFTAGVSELLSRIGVAIGIRSFGLVRGRGEIRKMQ